MFRVAVIGVGELAISDHRSSQPTAAELRRVASEANLGGILSGRGGRVMLHLGDGKGRLAPVREALSGSDLAANSFYPTHVNRSPALLAEAAGFARDGGYIDITVSTTAELVAAGDMPALVAFTDRISRPTEVGEVASADADLADR